jgi:hypothetical protein
VLLVRVDIAQEQETALDGPETFKLTATNTGGTGYDGTGTIVDDGTGMKYPDLPPTNPSTPASSTDNLDDDRALTVNSVTVNEASPWAVFSVTGVAGQKVTLSLTEGSGAGFANIDETKKLQYWDAAANAGLGGWVDYTAASLVTLPAGGVLLVRVDIAQEQEAVLDGPETFKLTASNTSGAGYEGTGTIVDDGTGVKYPDLPPTNPSTPASSTDSLDDDRPLIVSDITVHESLGHAVFTVAGAQNQWVTLDLIDGSATEAAGDYGPTLEYFDGVNWVVYSGQFLSLGLAGQINVRTPLNDDGVPEGLETLQLAARNTGYDGVLGEFRGTARVPDRVVELYVMENETSITAYINHFVDYNQYEIVGGSEASMFVPGPGGSELAFKLPATYVLGGDNQHQSVAKASAVGKEPDQALFIVNVISFKAIQITPLTALQLDRQTGLYKQKIRVENLHVHSIGGLRFTMQLIPGATLFNSNGDGLGGTPAIRYDGVLARIGQAGNSFDVNLEVLYQSLSSTNSGGGAILPNPIFTPDLIVMNPVTPSQSNTHAGQSVNFIRLFNGDLMIEWDTVVGQTYAVEYSADLQNWIRVTPLINANSARTQWIDNGSPKTMSHPSTSGSRFYRVIPLPAQN